MGVIKELVTDRTLADVTRWRTLRDKGYANMTAEERAEWDAGLKGAYNYTDLNRVGEALNYVRDRLAAAGYMSTLDFTARTDWAEGVIPPPVDLVDLLQYVSIVRGALAQFRTTPPVPEYSGGLDYQEANAIEQIIFDVDKLITNTLAAFVYCGEIFCGEI